MPLDRFCQHHLSFFFSCFWRTQLFCLRQSTFYGAFNDSTTEVAGAVFRFRPEAVPRSSLSFPFITQEEGERRGDGWGLLAPVWFCVSLLTLQQKWEEASGLPGILWGRKRGHWRGHNLGTKRQSNVIFVGVMKGRTATQLGDS